MKSHFGVGLLGLDRAWIGLDRAWIVRENVGFAVYSEYDA